MAEESLRGPVATNRIAARFSAPADEGLFSTADLEGQEISPYLEGAAIAIDSHTGGIRAVAGGRDYERSKFNRALLGRRQIGSSVKPFVYAKGLRDRLATG